MLIAILKKQLDLPGELYTILQGLSPMPFEQVLLYPLLKGTTPEPNPTADAGQLSLFDSCPNTAVSVPRPAVYPQVLSERSRL